MTASHKPSQPLRCDPELLVQAPEMAILRVLHEALEAACFALFAEHPSLVMEDTRRTDPPTLRLAQRLIRRAALLDRDLRRYAAAVDDALRPPASDDLPDIPF
jgi:hypothetical protein